jgi:hypothetical protein
MQDILSRPTSGRLQTYAAIQHWLVTRIAVCWAIASSVTIVWHSLCAVASFSACGCAQLSMTVSAAIYYEMPHAS